MNHQSLLLSIALFSASAVIAPCVHAADPVAAATPCVTCTPSAAAPAAPDKMTRQEKMQKHMEMLTKQLNLTPAQQTQIHDIILADMKSMHGQREANQSLTDQERQAKRMATMTKMHADIRAVLTPDQQAKFDTMKMHQHGGGAEAPDTATQPTQ